MPIIFFGEYSSAGFFSLSARVEGELTHMPTRFATRNSASKISISFFFFFIASTAFTFSAICKYQITVVKMIFWFNQVPMVIHKFLLSSESLVQNKIAAI